MNILTFSDELEALVPKDAVLEQLGTGFRFVEGPVWDSLKQCLYFTDIPADTIYRWSLSEGFVVFRTPSQNANGLTLDRQRRLLACHHGSRKVDMTDLEEGTITDVATHYDGKRLNSPNDIVVHSDGSIYFTDPPYGLKATPEKKELPFQGVYRYDPVTKELRLLVDDFEKPNGLAFSPDEKTLYIDDSARDHVRAFDVTPAGTLVNGRIFTELDPNVGNGVVDGMKVDSQGNLYVTGRGGIWIISPSGKKLGSIRMPEVTANLAWGGDGRDLYITASTSLYRIRLNAQGIPPKVG